MDQNGFSIKTADGVDDLDAVRGLFREYHAWLGDVVCATTLGDEIDSLPVPYASPTGRLLVALAPDGTAAGCVGVRRFEDGVCEMKRLYVPPACRGRGLGRALAEAALAAAAELGYDEVRLTTLPGAMPEAGSLYRHLGFVERGPFYDFSRVSDDVEIIFMSRPPG